MPGASEYDSWDESEVVNFMFAFVVIVIIYFIRWCILCHYYQNSARTVKKYPHREKTTPFPNRPVSWTPDRTVPRTKQNTAPWPESGRGCTVRSGDPRRSGVPRSSLLRMYFVQVYSWNAHSTSHKVHLILALYLFEYLLGLEKYGISRKLKSV